MARYRSLTTRFEKAGLRLLRNVSSTLWHLHGGLQLLRELTPDWQPVARRARDFLGPLNWGSEQLAAPIPPDRKPTSTSVVGSAGG